jgi:hypothetical protein
MWRDRTCLTVAVVCLGFGLLVFGCGQHSADEAAREVSLPTAENAPRYALGVALAPAKAAADPDGAAPVERFTSTAEGLNRKIIYNAHVELAVEDFTGVPDRVIELVKKFDAYVADSSLSGSSGENRRGTWKIRVPVARFDEFVGAAKGLGELVRVGTSSRDVSEEYYDVDARIRNKTKEEERLLKLLEERPGKLEDVIAIERELSRVREELERMQGRMRVLTDLTSLTTIDLSITEIKGYQPPETPTLATRVRRSFEVSLDTLRAAGEELLIAVVWTVPWMPLAAIALVPVYVAARRVRRASRAVTPHAS